MEQPRPMGLGREFLLKRAFPVFSSKVKKAQKQRTSKQGVCASD